MPPKIAHHLGEKGRASQIIWSDRYGPRWFCGGNLYCNLCCNR